MPDSFGMCGIMAFDAQLRLALPDRYRSFVYDPQKYKDLSDRAWKTKSGKTGWQTFENEHMEDFDCVKCENFEINTLKDLNKFFLSTSPLKRGEIALICQYPKYSGCHTHWLAAIEKGDKVQLVGDMTPFGIQVMGVEINKQVLVKAMAKTLNTSPSTNLTEALLATNNGELDGPNKFKLNAIVFHFRQKSS